jgi:hypothetical protein
MALVNYLNKSSGVVPITMAESTILSPVFEMLNAVAQGTLDASFTPVEPVRPVESVEQDEEGV